ncbi:B3 domain-containing protein-like [Forsythia ovata]|uniref:B3 domain-containing protein-like n=1 Tax=Forsythia ovata TaxID=205694 RepID=A0ABD1TST2_9LAMI
MVQDGKACQECSRNCLLTHQKQKNVSPIVTRFFKIMLGDDYLKVLYLPPSFVREVRNTIGRPSYLEDSTGQQWPVKVSVIDGCLAIQEGWHKFALDHRLEVGELLVFFYIKGSHFVVQIYGTSARERLKFNRRRGRPRKRSREEEIIVPDEPFWTLDINSRGKPGSSTSVASGSEFQHGQSLPKVASNSGCDFGKRQFGPTTISTDDPVLMLNTNAGYNQGEDRTYLQDLSSFEMGRNEANPIKPKKSSLGGEIVPDHPQIRKQTESTDNDIQMVENEEGHISGHYNDVLFGAFPTESAENSNTSKGTPNVHSNYPNDQRNNAVQGGDRVFSSDGELPSIGRCKIAVGECALIPKYRDSIPMLQDPFGGLTVSVKKELVEMGEVAFGRHQISSGKEPNMGIRCAPMPLRPAKNINSIVKTEPDMLSALVPYVADGPLSVEVKCQSYLELPISLPPIEGRNEGGDTQLIFLRDSVGRLWPILCTKTLDAAAFVDGWKQFCKKNDIQPGDICEFKLENNVKRIYGVDVISKLVG